MWVNTATKSKQSNILTIDPDLRVEWLKCRARATRWKEEIMLLEEEMHRAIQFCAWKVNWWDKQAHLRNLIYTTSPWWGYHCICHWTCCYWTLPDHFLVTFLVCHLTASKISFGDVSEGPGGYNRCYNTQGWAGERWQQRRTPVQPRWQVVLVYNS